jgi:hypothetical protein
MPQKALNNKQMDLTNQKEKMLSDSSKCELIILLLDRKKDS